MSIRSARLSYTLAALLVLGVVALNTYRAATQSITVDEAFTYNEFVAPPFLKTLASYDANNHILFTYAARLTTAVFSVSEFTLRLPSVISGLIFLAAVCMLCARALGPSLLFAAGIGMVALNPFVLDYLSAARGYGLALACWFSALLALLVGLRRARAPYLVAVASLGAMLAVAANLTFAFPTAGLLGTASLLLILTRKWRLVPHLLLPAVLVGALLLLSPLRHARPSDFYHGADTVSQTIQSLGAYTFFYGSDTFNLDGRPYWLTWPQRRVLSRLQWALLLVGVGAIAVTLRGLWRAGHGSEMDDLSLLLVLVGGSSAIGGLALLSVHHLMGVKYPASRSGLFWIVSASLLGPLLAGKLRQSFRTFRPVTAALAGCGLMCAAYLASEVRTTDYAEWRFDAGTRDMVVRVNALRHEGARMRVGATWMLASSMEFYRRIWGLHWDPVRRLPPWQLEQGARSGAFDYVVLLPQDQVILQRIGWTPLFRDTRTGALLAGPAAAFRGTSRPSAPWSRRSGPTAPG